MNEMKLDRQNNPSIVKDGKESHAICPYVDRRCYANCVAFIKLDGAYKCARLDNDNWLATAACQQANL